MSYQIYNALRSRNALGLAIQTLSNDTGDAAELIAGLGPQGQFNSAYNNLSTLASNACTVKESHHFYPLLFLFPVHRAVLLGLEDGHGTSRQRVAHQERYQR
jgi:hypothetical protein